MSPILLHGDCLELISTIADHSIDMVLCDLPYGTTGHRWDTPIDLDALWGEYTRVCKKNAAILLFAQCPFDKVLGCSNLKNLRYEWVWEKNCPTGFQSANRMPLKSAENILVFYRALPTYNPQGLRDIEPRVDKRGASSEHLRAFTGGEYRSPYVKTKEGYPRNVLRFPVERGLHPTQKPIVLLEYLIRTYTNPGDTVLDNTMGSGSTIVAACNAGRVGIGIEKEQSYYDVACERIRKTSAPPKHSSGSLLLGQLKAKYVKDASKEE